MSALEKLKKSRYWKLLVYLYMGCLTVAICYVASKIYKADDMIWPRERYIIVATMVISYFIVLFRLFTTRKMPIGKAACLYHFILIGTMIIMAFPLDYYELRPLYLIPMVVVIFTDLSFGLLTGIAVVLSTYVMIFTNLAEFMYVALLIMVLGCISASCISDIRKFAGSSLIFWAGSFYLCGLYRYFALDAVYETFQFRFASIGLMVAAASSVVLFVLKYWIFFIRIQMFADENSIPMKDMKEKSISLYYHSVETGGLAKSAAAATGADIRLAYAAGLLQNIGQMAESEDVRDALKLANEYGLPRNIKAILVESTGKYRKPATKEAAIVMLASSTVSAMEYLRNSGKDISEEKIIDNVFATRVNNGSLSNSGLTLEELYVIKKVFLKKYQSTT
jgi:hypothetical protein